MFGKFLLKNIPGSPGKTASSLIEEYKVKTQKFNGLEPIDIYLSIIVDRYSIAKYNSQCVYGKVKFHEILEENNEFSSFVYLVLLCESKKFRLSGVPNADENDYGFNLATEVIFEVCKDKLPSLTRCSLYEFREKAHNISQKFIFVDLF